MLLSSLKMYQNQHHPLPSFFGHYLPQDLAFSLIFFRGNGLVIWQSYTQVTLGHNIARFLFLLIAPLSWSISYFFISVDVILTLTDMVLSMIISRSSFLFY